MFKRVGRLRYLSIRARADERRKRAKRDARDLMLQNAKIALDAQNDNAPAVPPRRTLI